jgi:hypothetical protein
VFTFKGSFNGSNRPAGRMEGSLKRGVGNIRIRIEPSERGSRGTPLFKPRKVTAVMDLGNIFNQGWSWYQSRDLAGDTRTCIE